MVHTRRSMLISAAGASVALPAAAAGPSLALPAKAMFAPIAGAYLDSASTHPLPLPAAAAVNDYLVGKTRDRRAPPQDFGRIHRAATESFGKLVGAAADELTIVQSTTMGECLVIEALDIPRTPGRIVTDVLHYAGSFYTYAELGKAGMDVVTLPMTADGRIDYAGFEAAIDRRTRLVAISAVSATNGFEHDLKRVCDIAHAKGALVYVDIIQAAGANPIDLRAAGVDFAASASYKWLMGDFGFAFLYVRKEIQPLLKRPWFGHDQAEEIVPHVFPYDAPAPAVATYRLRGDAAGLFAMGTTCRTGEAMLGWSLPWLLAMDPARIRAWRQPLVDAIDRDLRHRGYRPMTPAGTKTQILTYAYRDARGRLGPRLERAAARISLLPNRFRISVSVFNDMNDVDRLLGALPAAG